MKLVIFLLIFFVSLVSSSWIRNFIDRRINRVCKSYRAYFNPFQNKDCYYDREFFQNITGILENRNIPYEEYKVTTEDEYILTLFRIKASGSPRGVVVFLNPLSADNVIWLVGFNNSIVSTVLNAGYEVWLPNWRGVRFSRGHVHNLDTLQYWNFSFHEIGVYDYSAIFKFVHNMTDTKAIGISHSMGSTAAFAYASIKPDEAKKYVKIIIATGSSSYMATTSQLIKILSWSVPIIKRLQNIFKFGALFESHRKAQDNLKKIILFFLQPILVLAMPVIAGGGFQANPEYIPMVFSVALQPVGIKCLYHYAQLMYNGDKFSQYDYGEKGNLELYNSKKPPQYPLNNILIPIYLVYGTKDNMGDPEDTENLYKHFSKKAKKYGKLKIENYSHVDFLWARTAKEELLDKLLYLVNNL